MTSRATLIHDLMAYARAKLYHGRSDRDWFTQQDTVKKAVTYIAAKLDETKVQLSAARYRAIVIGIIDTMVHHGDLRNVEFMSGYLLHCVQAHWKHHGDSYYAEGRDIRNCVSLAMSTVERARRGEDSTVPILSAVHQGLVSKGGRKKKQPSVQPLLLLNE